MTSLQAQGWLIDEIKLEETLGDEFNLQISSSELSKLLLDLDIKDYTMPVLNEKLSKGKFLTGPMILQLSKWQNVSYPSIADHEDNNGVCVYHLSDGSRTVKAMATEPISKLDGNTIYGTKISLTGDIKIENSILQLSNKNTNVLGGRVERRVDEWRAEKLGNKENRKNAISGAPKWVPFEKRFLVKHVSTDDNFKSMNLLKESKKDDEAEDTVFDTVRKAEIENLKLMKKSFNLPQINDEIRKEILPEKVEKREMREPKERRQNDYERTQKANTNRGGRGRGRREREIESNEYSRPTTTGSLFDYLQASTGGNAAFPLERKQDYLRNELNSQFSQLNITNSQQDNTNNYRARGRGRRDGDQMNREGQINNDQRGNVHGRGRSTGRGLGRAETSSNQKTANSTPNRGRPSSARVFYSSSRGRGRSRG